MTDDELHHRLVDEAPFVDTIAFDGLGEGLVQVQLRLDERIRFVFIYRIDTLQFTVTTSTVYRIGISAFPRRL
jgi:hypothetical protein